MQSSPRLIASGSDSGRSQDPAGWHPPPTPSSASSAPAREREAMQGMNSEQLARVGNVQEEARQGGERQAE
eukprot:10294349-Alexandrium_andersonii.AAC.1